MTALPTGGFKLFRAFGIQVYLHWSWLIVAYFEIQHRKGGYSSIGWNIAEYVTHFVIVTLHEFGHALACKSVGGSAERIMLWPLGGVAYVRPPQRPGAVLWSIAAGPLVNVVLVPVTVALLYSSGAWAAIASNSPTTDLQSFIYMMTLINAVLLVFNMLPIFPLDGGQILRALLWFIIGAGKSLQVASIVGLIGAGLGIALSLPLVSTNPWLLLIAGFAGIQSWNAFQQSRIIRTLSEAPRRPGLHCPHCGEEPPAGPIWICSCGNKFDIFEARGQCPKCGAASSMIPCPNCGKPSHPVQWYAPQMQSGQR